MTRKTILIAGGGVGGLVTANLLAKSVGKNHRIVLIDRSSKYTFSPSFPWLMIGVRNSDQICRDLKSLTSKGIEFVEGNITAIDPENRSVRMGNRRLSGDYLVIALGAELNSGEFPGLKEVGHSFYTLEGSERLRDSFRHFTRGKLVVLIPSIPYKCPAAPYEGAMLMEYDLRKRKVRDDVSISMFAAEPGPMGVAGKTISTAVRQMLEEKGIQYFPDHPLESVNPEKKILEFSNEIKAYFDFLVYVPPHRVPKAVQDVGLIGASGWVTVDRHTLETPFSNVYALGDVTSIPLALRKPLPKAGVFAHYQAEIVANNITVDITGKGSLKKFNGDGECFIELGDRKAGFARGNFYTEPLPKVKMYKPGRHWHAGKVLFEKDWMRRWF